MKNLMKRSGTDTDQNGDQEIPNLSFFLESNLPAAANNGKGHHKSNVARRNNNKKKKMIPN